MGLEYEAEQQHLLTMVERAQKAGRSERDIIAIVDQYFGTDVTVQMLGRRRRSVLRRLFANPLRRRATA
ncbi:MAG: hypothetical protein H0X39_03200 [Actinobacteria bacterium]|nr:hypothetical protein [Actinomycetota bacterium]